jgi:hypothetical protein
MRLKSVFVTAFLLLTTMFVAYAKTYDIHLSSAAVAGTVQLPAGEYKLKVNGANAVLVDVDSHESYTVPVKVQTSDKKYDQDAVVTTNNNGATKIEAIELGGSTTRLAFGE